MAADQGLLETLPVLALRSERDGQDNNKTSSGNQRIRLMTMKILLGTAALGLLLGGGAGTAQAQVALGHLADYSGPTSDVGTPFGQGVADAFAYVNKNGG